MKFYLITFLFITSQSFAAIKPQLFTFGEKPRLSKASAKTEVDLAMAHEEYETFIVTLPESTAKDFISKVKLVWKDKTPAQVELKTYRLYGHNFKSSSFKSGFKAGEIADIPVPLESVVDLTVIPPSLNKLSQPQYLFEIYVPRATKEGLFTGELTFSIQKEDIKIPIKLEVFDVNLPTKFNLKTTFGFAPWEVLLKHYGAWNKDERSLYDKYYDAALEHRIDLHKIYEKFPDAKAKDPLVDMPSGSRSFTLQTKPLFDGLKSSHGYQMTVTDLPVPKEYKTTENEYPLTVADVEAFWKKLNTSVVKNNLVDKTFVYYVDEPAESELRHLGQQLRQIKKWAPNIKFLVTSPWRQTLQDAIDIWVVNLFLWERPTEKPPEFYKKLQSQGQELWFYVGCNSHGCTSAEDVSNPDFVIDRPSAYLRAFPWMALRYGATGLLYYDTVYSYSHGGDQSPWQDGFEFTGYGEGSLFYPCTQKLGKCATPKVFPALRLKILRDGLEDAQIIKMAIDKGFDEKNIKNVIKNSRDFSIKTEDYDLVKRQALMFLTKSSDKKKK